MVMATDKQASDSWIVPDWPAPDCVQAITTTRLGGVSIGSYAGLNLAQHVGDQLSAVQANRQWLKHSLQLPEEPRWLNQVHGTQMLDADTVLSPQAADGSYSFVPGRVCGVLTADCLPVLLCEASGARVAVVHAGWRGLAAGVIESAVHALASSGSARLIAWLGPAIGPSAFEVGDEVRACFLAKDAHGAEAFVPISPGRWHGDLYLLAKQRLASLGVVDVYGGGFCTYQDAARFYSFRRDGDTGRMATLIWMQGQENE